jgi:dihydroneopterin aldolase
VGKIKLKNVRIYAYHGCLIEEGQIGSEYSVDLIVNADLLKSAKTDNLSDTVDYVFLNKIIEKEMAIRSKLLETVANRIIERILSESKLVNKVKVVISKINPPIEGDVEMVSIIMERNRI